jgi:hypothetical protein
MALTTNEGHSGSAQGGAADVCRALGIKNPRQALSYLDDDEKDSVITNDAIERRHEMAIVSESGLYSLILRSRKSAASPLSGWQAQDIGSEREAGGPGLLRRGTIGPEPAGNKIRRSDI